MKKLIVAAIICILCLAGSGRAAWYGTVYRDGQPQKYAVISTNPTGGYYQTASGGGYQLDELHGMEHGTYYNYIRADYDIYSGKNYVQDYYYRDVPKTGLDINLSIYGQDPP